MSINCDRAPAWSPAWTFIGDLPLAGLNEVGAGTGTNLGLHFHDSLPSRWDSVMGYLRYPTLIRCARAPAWRPIWTFISDLRPSQGQ
jgi:hypothetical protein